MATFCLNFSFTPPTSSRHKSPRPWIFGLIVFAELTLSQTLHAKNYTSEDYLAKFCDCHTQTLLVDFGVSVRKRIQGDLSGKFKLSDSQKCFDIKLVKENDTPQSLRFGSTLIPIQDLLDPVYPIAFNVLGYGTVHTMALVDFDSEIGGRVEMKFLTKFYPNMLGYAARGRFGIDPREILESSDWVTQEFNLKKSNGRWGLYTKTFSYPISEIIGRISYPADRKTLPLLIKHLVPRNFPMGLPGMFTAGPPVSSPFSSMHENLVDEHLFNLNGEGSARGLLGCVDF